MNSFIVILLGVVSVALLVFMILKKMDIKISLLTIGILLMYVSLALGKKVVTSAPTGASWLNPIQAVVDQFTTTLAGPGFVILILAGYSAYMSKIGANAVTVNALTKPLKRVKSVYILVPVVFLIGNVLSLVVPSASNLAIILLATLYPVLRATGMTRLSAGAVIATSATIVPTPLGSDNVAMAAALHLPVTEYVFKYHALISIPTLIFIAIVHYFWQKNQDKKHSVAITEKEEIQEVPEDIHKNDAFGYRVMYGLLPVMPIILLVLAFFINMGLKTPLQLTVQIVSIVSLFVAILTELSYKKNVNQVLKETDGFFTGMGGAMGIVGLLVAAQTFVAGLTSLGIMEMVQKAMATVHGSGVILPIIMVAFTAVIVLLSGSGIALIFAMIPLVVPLAHAAGISPEALSVPLQLSGNLFRAVSPVAAVVLIVAGTTKLDPAQIVKRTSVPMIAGVLFMLVLSLVLL